jgi:acetyl esterase/lipase
LPALTAAFVSNLNIIFANQRQMKFVLVLTIALTGAVFHTTAQTLPTNYRVTNNMPYVTDGQSRQWMDLYYVPSNAPPTPVVLWVHGGGWASENENNPRALALTNHNIAVAAISYRYTTNSPPSPYPLNLPHPAQIQDVKSAIRWLRANATVFNLDTNRIGMWGFSAGGHLSALTGTSGHTNLFDVGEHLGQSSRVQAVVDMTGPTDLLQVPTTVPGFDYDLWLLGDYATNNPPTLATVNSINFVRGDAPPFRIIHGEADPNVNILASQLLHSALTNAGVSSTFIRLPGVGHTIPATQDAPAAQWLADMFNWPSNFSLTISNHSFEFPSVPSNSFNVAAPPPGWFSYGSINNNNRSVGVLDPAGSTLYAGPVPLGENVGVTFLMDNPQNQIFFANSEAGLRQTLAATLQTKRRYTLRVEVGNIANDVDAPFAFAGFPNYRIDLMAGTNVIVSDFNTLLPGEGLFLTSTVAVNVAASNPFGGQQLGIRLVNLNSAPGIEVNWDNVRLESSPIPPPTMTVARFENSLQVTWPATASGFTLQSATNLAPPVNWQPAELTVVQTNGHFRATAILPSTGERFFRLLGP